jgi:peptidyl-dipeptidase Dcp
VFDQELAAKLKKYVYSAGNTVDAMGAFSKVRGREPDATAMLVKKGLTST